MPQVWVVLLVEMGECRIAGAWWFSGSETGMWIGFALVGEVGWDSMIGGWIGPRVSRGWWGGLVVMVLVRYSRVLIIRVWMLNQLGIDEVSMVWALICSLVVSV